MQNTLFFLVYTRLYLYVCYCHRRFRNAYAFTVHHNRMEPGKSIPHVQAHAIGSSALSTRVTARSQVAHIVRLLMTFSRHKKKIKVESMGSLRTALIFADLQGCRWWLPNDPTFDGFVQQLSSPHGCHVPTGRFANRDFPDQSNGLISLLVTDGGSYLG